MSMTSRAETELDSTDQQLKHISEDILPEDPYLLDLYIPSRIIVDQNHVNDWREGYPFWQASEEQLQYISFLSHAKRNSLHNHLRVIEDWSDGKGGLREGPSRRTSASSTGSIGSPAPGQSRPFRKKITLADYQKRATAQAQGKRSPESQEVAKKMTEPLDGKPTVTEKGETSRVVEAKSLKKAPDQVKKSEKVTAMHGQKRYLERFNGELALLRCQC